MTIIKGQLPRRRFIVAGMAAAAGCVFKHAIGTREESIAWYDRGALLNEYRLDFQKRLRRTFNSCAAFGELTKLFLRKGRTSHIYKTGKLNILYLASGSHLAPLEIALHALKNKKIKMVEYTYTEQDPFMLEELRSSLSEFRRLGLLRGFREESINVSPGSEVVFHLDLAAKEYRGKRITIKFALNRSPGYFRYFRQEYFDAADIVIIHDADESKEGDTPDGSYRRRLYNRLFDNIMEAHFTANTEKPRSLFTDDYGQSIMIEGPEGDYLDTGITHRYAANLKYGCRNDDSDFPEKHDHLDNPNWHRAIMVRLLDPMDSSFSALRRLFHRE